MPRGSRPGCLASSAGLGEFIRCRLGRAYVERHGDPRIAGPGRPGPVRVIGWEQQQETRLRNELPAVRAKILRLLAKREQAEFDRAWLLPGTRFQLRDRHVIDAADPGNLVNVPALVP